MTEASYRAASNPSISPGASVLIASLLIALFLAGVAVGLFVTERPAQTARPAGGCHD